MKKIILIAIVVSALAACSKDKFKSQPQLSIFSYNTKVVGPNEHIVIQLKYTDKEGDLGEGQLTYIPIRINQRKLPADKEPLSDSTNIPKYPNTNTGFVQLDLPWSSLHQDYIRENDTIYFRFVAKDLAGNMSDTVDSAPVVFLQQ